MVRRRQPPRVTAISLAIILAETGRASDMEKAKSKGALIVYNTRGSSTRPVLELLQFDQYLVRDTITHDRSNIWKKETWDAGLKEYSEVHDRFLHKAKALKPTIFDDEAQKTMNLLHGTMYRRRCRVAYPEEVFEMIH